MRQVYYNTSANSTTLIAAGADVPPLVPTEAAAEHRLLWCVSVPKTRMVMPPLPGPPAARPLEVMVLCSDVGYG